MVELAMAVRCVELAQIILVVCGLLGVLWVDFEDRRIAYLQVLVPSVGLLGIALGVLGLFVGPDTAELLSVDHLVSRRTCFGGMLTGAVSLGIPFAPRHKAIWPLASLALVAGVCLQAGRCSPTMDLIADLISPEADPCTSHTPLGSHTDIDLLACLKLLLEPLVVFGPPAAIYWTHSKESGWT